MAGHSKWANIQHRKGRQDAARSKLFSKLSKEITVAAKMGDPDPEKNPRLRLAVKEAKSNSVPKDVIDRAIKKATGGDAENYDEIRYEGYGPNGVAIMVDCMTDNKNRTVSEVRYTFNRNGGNLGADGSVAYLFDRKGVLTYGPDNDDEDVLAPALDAGAEDLVEYEDGSFDVLTAPDDYNTVKAAVEAAGFAPDAGDVTMRPATTVELQGEDAQSCLKLLDALEDLDDVQNVYSNVELDEETLSGAPA